MELLQPRHLVLVRHGESQGDVRRKQKISALRHPINEEQTEVGHNQSHATGTWIAKHILEAYGLKGFAAHSWLMAGIITVISSSACCPLFFLLSTYTRHRTSSITTITIALLF